MAIGSGDGAVKYSFTASGSATNGSPGSYDGAACVVLGPESFWVDGSGTMVEATVPRSCRLSLIMVVNTSILGLLGVAVFAAVEISSHLFA